MPAPKRTQDGALAPSGTVTFFFTDIQGSTRLWQEQPRRMRAALARHDGILRTAIAAHGGWVFKTVGDAFCAAFRTALEGLEAAVEAQRALDAESWDLPTPILVRMALHAGEAEERDSDYFGTAVNRVARLLSVGHGGQILLSLVATELVRDMLPEGMTLREMGEQRLKDLTRPESVYQLVAPGLAAEFPPLKSLDTRPHNLPLQPTALIGREREISELAKLMRDPQARVVTLTGPGGIGKTRLALQVAAETIEVFDHGAFFVDLSSATEPDHVLAALARCLMVKEGPRPLQAALRELLSERSMLLVLDNFEQVVEAAEVVRDLLSACPGVRALVTSREALRLRGERVYAVGALAFPRGRVQSLARLGQYEAVQLFLERAVEARRDFTVTNETAPAVAEICARLDGIPLAIELAAAHTRLLTPRQILERVGSRLQLLSGGPRDLPPRQRTLRAAIDWSYDLLDGRLKRLFESVCVFSGSFSLEGAASVIGAASVGGGDVVEGIENLTDKSLVTTLPEGERGGHAMRCRVLETLREYGLEKLAAHGEIERLRTAHARHYSELGLRSAPELRGRHEREVLERLEWERYNLRAALAWYGREGRWPDYARLCASLWRFWRIRGTWAEGRLHLGRALEHLEETGVAPCRGELLIGAGVLARLEGRWDESLKYLVMAGQTPRAAEAALELGWTRFSRGEMELARELFAASAATPVHVAGSEAIGGLAALGLGCVAWRMGALDEARSRFEQARGVLRSLELCREEALAVGNLGLVCHGTGDAAEAQRHLQRAAELLEAVGDHEALAATLNNLGSLTLDRKEPREALRHYARLLTLSRSGGDRRFLCMAHVGIADAYLALGDADRAGEHAEASIPAARDFGGDTELGLCYRAAGDACAARGRTAEAREHYKEAIRYLGAAGEVAETEKARAGLARVGNQQGGAT